jgi:cyclohexyl-isocyanide hydratase
MLQIGSLLFPGIDQIDLTGPFEVLSRIPDATHRLYGVTPGIVRDVRGLGLIADAVLADAPQLDVLHVPGGFGQEDLMDDREVLEWIRGQAKGARIVFSVCTGALILGAAGLLEGRRATTHWAAHHLLDRFGAYAADERVVVDDKFVFAAGVTAGIDGALTVAAMLAGEEIAQTIQLTIAYAPEPPFNSGTPATAPPSVLESARNGFAAITRQREATAERLYQSRRAHARS